MESDLNKSEWLSDSGGGIEHDSLGEKGEGLKNCLLCKKAGIGTVLFRGIVNRMKSARYLYQREGVDILQFLFFGKFNAFHGRVNLIALKKYSALIIYRLVHIEFHSLSFSFYLSSGFSKKLFYNFFITFIAVIFMLLTVISYRNGSSCCYLNWTGICLLSLLRIMLNTFFNVC